MDECREEIFATTYGKANDVADSRVRDAMAVPHQKVIIAGIWVLTVGDAVRQGIYFPTVMAKDLERSIPVHTFVWELVVLGLLGPPVLLLTRRVLLKHVPKLRRRRDGFLTRWLDRRWGAGSGALFSQDLRPMALMICTVVVLGSVALLSCLYFEASLVAFSIASFFLSSGIGFWIARDLAAKVSPDGPTA